MARAADAHPEPTMGRSGKGMWFVRLALRRPYTFVVVAMFIAVLGVLSIVSVPTDIFPSSFSPKEMQDRITTIVERAFTTAVDNIEHLESLSVRGTSVIKLYLQPNADVNGRGGASDGHLSDSASAPPHGHFAATDHPIEMSGMLSPTCARSSRKSGACARPRARPRTTFGSPGCSTSKGSRTIRSSSTPSALCWPTSCSWRRPSICRWAPACI